MNDSPLLYWICDTGLCKSKTFCLSNKDVSAVLETIRVSPPDGWDDRGQ